MRQNVVDQAINMALDTIKNLEGRIEALQNRVHTLENTVWSREAVSGIAENDPDHGPRSPESPLV